jgi:acyl-CoA synthetase (AMP-forming)/AMP-acid ligase II
MTPLEHGGENIFPVEIESYIMGHPKVKDRKIGIKP